MLLWDVKWEEFEDDVAELDLSQRINIALASLENVLKTSADYFKSSLDSEQKKLIHRALDVCWSGSTQRKELIVDKLSEQIEVNNKPGVYDLLMGVLTLLKASDVLTGDDTLEVLSYLYQSVLDREIISELEKDTLESEVQEMEKNNRECLKAIGDQLRYLHEIKEGKLFERQVILL